MNRNKGYERFLKTCMATANSEQRSVYKEAIRNTADMERPMHMDIVPMAKGVVAPAGAWWGERKLRGVEK